MRYVSPTKRHREKPSLVTATALLYLCQNHVPPGYNLGAMFVLELISQYCDVCKALALVFTTLNLSADVILDFKECHAQI